MTKQLLFLLCTFFGISIHASDPRITQAFEEQPHAHAPHQNEHQKLEPHFSTEDFLQLIIQLNQEKILAEEKVKELEKLNKRLEGDADEVLKERCEKSECELKQSELARNTIFWILAPCIPTATIVGAAIPETAKAITSNINNNQGTIRTKMIPGVIAHLMHTYELNKTLAQATSHGIRVEVKGSQPIEIIYNTLNSSELQALVNNSIQHGKLWIAQYNLAEKLEGHEKIITQTKFAIDKAYTSTKEDLARVLLAHIATSILIDSIRVTDDSVLIGGPNKTIVLHKSQLVEAGTEAVATCASDFIRDKQSPTICKTGSDFALHVGTEIGYNTLVQLIHKIAKKTDCEHNALKVLLPEDCKPKDDISFYTKIFIRYGVGYSASLLAPSAQALAIWALNYTVLYLLSGQTFSFF